jgi:NAD(P)-dependent dehydrogenase (short-subunit alcohol dehydrogenase family)
MGSLPTLFKEKYDLPAEPEKSFAGKTVLITGATSGLGLEAAKKFAALEAWTVIITARDQAKGEMAKAEIEYVCQEKAMDQLDIQVWPLDMSDFSSVKKFADRVKNELPRLDAAILNAGQINATWSKVPDENGPWEMTLMVNTLATLFLGLLLLPKLLSTAKTTSTDSTDRPHLNFSSSALIQEGNLRKYKKHIDGGRVLEALSEKAAFEGGKGRYELSKLFLEYGMRRIATLSSVVQESGEKTVIVNSTCPGLCKSEIGRSMARYSLIYRFLIWLHQLIFARSAHQGSRSYVSGVTQGEESHGKMWKNDKYYE